MTTQPETPKRRPGRPRKHPLKPKLARGGQPKSSAELQRDAYMFRAVEEFRKGGVTLLEACQLVSETMAGHRGYMERERAHKGRAEAPTKIAIRSRIKRIRTEPRGVGALNAIIQPSPDIQALPEGRERGMAMLQRLLDGDFEPSFLDMFKASAKRVVRIGPPR